MHRARWGAGTGRRPAALALATLATAASVLAACGTGGSLPRPAVAGGRPPSSSGPSGGQRSAVVRAWLAGEQTVYRYDREPWPAIRRELIAGTPPLQVFPDLGRYFTGAALSGVIQSVVGIKLQELDGAKVDRLGSPTVISQTATSATVASCGYDSGTTTADGSPGPATLDGGAGYGKGRWELRFVDGEWKIAGGEAEAVSSC